jgi:peptidoglycan hydrolase-like protein with peptidoglycan-binding domain
LFGAEAQPDAGTTESDGEVLGAMAVEAALGWGKRRAHKADCGEHPPGSNHTVVWKHYRRITGAPAYQGQPWCGAMLIDLVFHAGEWHAPANWIGVYAIQSWGEAHGRFHRGTHGVRPGDALIIGGPGQHTGMARSDARADGSVLTVEGNTSPGSEGSQFNGGTVALKARTASEIFGYVAIHDLLNGATPPPLMLDIDDRVEEPGYRPETEQGPLRLWRFGPRVEAMQDRLGVPSDGYYGRQTQRAVAAFKRDRGLAGGGRIAGVDVLDLLAQTAAPRRAFVVLRRGDKGAAVRKLQRRLNGHGEALDVDGDFGPETEAAVNRLKSMHSLPADGVAGRGVWAALAAGPLSPTVSIPAQRHAGRRTPRRMFDSTTAGDVPAKARMVAGYVDGSFQTVEELRRRFPRAQVVSITVLGTPGAHVCDTEPGNISISGAVRWAADELHAGRRPTVYCTASQWPQVKAAVEARGLAGKVSYWIANYDGRAAIPRGAVAKQYADPKLTGKHFDVSVVARHWPGVDS